MRSTSKNTPQYLSLYGMSTAPFRLSPDPYFFFPSPTHVSAEKILNHAVANGEGFMVLTGQAGLGKTLLLRRLLENFGEDKVPILILSPAVTPVGLLQLLLGEMDVSFASESSHAVLLQLFQDTVLALAKNQRELFIIVDEAQNMPVETLEQLRMLSNLETGQRKLMQILLIGQTELEDVLTDPGLGQLVQRIVIHERLEPLSREQISRYVSFRLNKAGRGDIVLSPGACRKLYRTSRGIPRLINRIMDRTLLLASVDRVTVLSSRHVASAVATMRDIRNARDLKRRSKLTFAVCAILLVVLLVVGLYYTPLLGWLKMQLAWTQESLTLRGYGNLRADVIFGAILLPGKELWG